MTTYDYIEFDGTNYQGFKNGNQTTKPTIHELYSKTASEYIDEDIILRLMGPDITIEDINCSKHLRIEPYFLRSSIMKLGDLDVGKNLTSIGESDSIHITSRTPVQVTGNVKVHTDHLNVGIKINGPERLVFSGEDAKVTQVMLYSNLREQEATDASDQFYAEWNDTADNSGILSTWEAQKETNGGLKTALDNADASLNNSSTNGGVSSLQDEFDDDTSALATATSRLNGKNMSSNYTSALSNLNEANISFNDASHNYNQALSSKNTFETQRGILETEKRTAESRLQVSQANYDEADASGEITEDISSNYYSDLRDFNDASDNFAKIDISFNNASNALTETNDDNKTLEEVFDDASGALNAVDENENTLQDLVDDASGIYHAHLAAVHTAAGDNSVYFEDVSTNYHNAVATALVHDPSFNVTDLSGIYHTAKKDFEDASVLHSSAVTALGQKETAISTNYLGGTFADLQTEYTARKTAFVNADEAFTDDISGDYHEAKKDFEDASTDLTNGQNTLSNYEGTKNTTAATAAVPTGNAAQDGANQLAAEQAERDYNDQYALVNGGSGVSDANSLVGKKTAAKLAFDTTPYGSTGVSIKSHYETLKQTLDNADASFNTETEDADGNKWDKNNTGRSIKTVYEEYVTKEGDVTTKLGEKNTAESNYTTGLIASYDALIGSKLVNVYDAFALNFTTAYDTLNADTLDGSDNIIKESLATRHTAALSAFNSADASFNEVSGAYADASGAYHREFPNIALLEERMSEALIHEMVLSIDSTKGGISLFESTTPIDNQDLYQRYVIDLSSFAQDTNGKDDVVQFENYDLSDSIEFPIRLTIGDDVNIGDTKFTKGLTFVHNTPDAEKTVKLKKCDIASDVSSVDLINVVNAYDTSFNTYDTLTNNKRLVLDMTSNNNKITLATNQHFLLQTETPGENLALAGHSIFIQGTVSKTISASDNLDYDSFNADIAESAEAFSGTDNWNGIIEVPADCTLTNFEKHRDNITINCNGESDITITLTSTSSSGTITQLVDNKFTFDNQTDNKVTINLAKEMYNAGTDAMEFIGRGSFAITGQKLTLDTSKNVVLPVASGLGIQIDCVTDFKIIKDDATPMILDHVDYAKEGAFRSSRSHSVKIMAPQAISVNLQGDKTYDNLFYTSDKPLTLNGSANNVTLRSLNVPNSELTVKKATVTNKDNQSVLVARDCSGSMLVLGTAEKRVTLDLSGVENIVNFDPDNSSDSLKLRLQLTDLELEPQHVLDSRVTIEHVDANFDIVSDFSVSLKNMPNDDDLYQNKFYALFDRLLPKDYFDRRSGLETDAKKARDDHVSALDTAQQAFDDASGALSDVNDEEELLRETIYNIENDLYPWDTSANYNLNFTPLATSELDFVTKRNTKLGEDRSSLADIQSPDEDLSGSTLNYQKLKKEAEDALSAADSALNDATTGTAGLYLAAKANTLTAETYFNAKNKLMLPSQVDATVRFSNDRSSVHRFGTILENTTIVAREHVTLVNNGEDIHLNNLTADNENTLVTLDSQNKEYLDLDATDPMGHANLLEYLAIYKDLDASSTNVEFASAPSGANYLDLVTDRTMALNSNDKFYYSSVQQADAWYSGNNIALPTHFGTVDASQCVFYSNDEKYTGKPDDYIDESIVKNNTGDGSKAIANNSWQKVVVPAGSRPVTSIKLDLNLPADLSGNNWILDVYNSEDDVANLQNSISTSAPTNVPVGPGPSSVKFQLIDDVSGSEFWFRIRSHGNHDTNNSLEIFMEADGNMVYDARHRSLDLDVNRFNVDDLTFNSETIDTFKFVVDKQHAADGGKGMLAANDTQASSVFRVINVDRLLHKFENVNNHDLSFVYSTKFDIQDTNYGYQTGPNAKVLQLTNANKPIDHFNARSEMQPYYASDTLSTSMDVSFNNGTMLPDASYNVRPETEVTVNVTSDVSGYTIKITKFSDNNPDIFEDDNMTSSVDGSNNVIDNSFTFTIPSGYTKNTFKIKATDASDNEAEISVDVERQNEPTAVTNDQFRQLVQGAGAKTTPWKFATLADAQTKAKESSLLTDSHQLPILVDIVQNMTLNDSASNGAGMIFKGNFIVDTLNSFVDPYKAEFNMINDIIDDDKLVNSVDDSLIILRNCNFGQVKAGAPIFTEAMQTLINGFNPLSDKNDLNLFIPGQPPLDTDKNIILQKTIDFTIGHNLNYIASTSSSLYNDQNFSIKQISDEYATFLPTKIVTDADSSSRSLTAAIGSGDRVELNDASGIAYDAAQAINSSQTDISNTTAIIPNPMTFNMSGGTLVVKVNCSNITVTGSGNIFLGSAFTSSLNISGSFHVQSETDNRGTLNIVGATTLDFNRLLNTTGIKRRLVKDGQADDEQKFPNCGGSLNNTVPNTPAISGNDNANKKLTIQTTSDDFSAYGNLENVRYILRQNTNFSMDDARCAVTSNTFDLNGTYSFTNYNQAANLELAGDTTIDFNNTTINNLKVKRESGVSQPTLLTLQKTNFELTSGTTSASGLINITNPNDSIGLDLSDSGNDVTYSDTNKCTLYSSNVNLVSDKNIGGDVTMNKGTLNFSNSHKDAVYNNNSIIILNDNVTNLTLPDNNSEVTLQVSASTTLNHLTCNGTGNNVKMQYTANNVDLTIDRYTTNNKPMIVTSSPSLSLSAGTFSVTGEVTNSVDTLLTIQDDKIGERLTKITAAFYNPASAAKCKYAMEISAKLDSGTTIVAGSNVSSVKARPHCLITGIDKHLASYTGTGVIFGTADLGTIAVTQTINQSSATRTVTNDIPYLWKGDSDDSSSLQLKWELQNMEISGNDVKSAIVTKLNAHLQANTTGYFTDFGTNKDFTYDILKIPRPSNTLSQPGTLAIAQATVGGRYIADDYELLVKLDGNEIPIYGSSNNVAAVKVEVDSNANTDKTYLRALDQYKGTPSRDSQNAQVASGDFDTKAKLWNNVNRLGPSTPDVPAMDSSFNVQYSAFVDENAVADKSLILDHGFGSNTIILADWKPDVPLTFKETVSREIVEVYDVVAGTISHEITTITDETKPSPNGDYIPSEWDGSANALDVVTLAAEPANNAVSGEIKYGPAPGHSKLDNSSGNWKYDHADFSITRGVDISAAALSPGDLDPTLDGIFATNPYFAIPDSQLADFRRYQALALDASGLQITEENLLKSMKVVCTRVDDCSNALIPSDKQVVMEQTLNIPIQFTISHRDATERYFTDQPNWYHIEYEVASTADASITADKTISASLTEAFTHNAQLHGINSGISMTITDTIGLTIPTDISNTGITAILDGVTVTCKLKLNPGLDSVLVYKEPVDGSGVTQDGFLTTHHPDKFYTKTNKNFTTDANKNLRENATNINLEKGGTSLVNDLKSKFYKFTAYRAVDAQTDASGKHIVTLSGWTVSWMQGLDVSRNASGADSSSNLVDVSNINIGDNNKRILVWSNWGQAMGIKYSNLNNNSFMDSVTEFENRVKLEKINSSVEKHPNGLEITELAETMDSSGNLIHPTFSDISAQTEYTHANLLMNVFKISAEDHSDLIVGDIKGKLEMLMVDPYDANEYLDYDVGIELSETESYQLDYSLKAGDAVLASGQAVSTADNTDPHKFNLTAPDISNANASQTITERTLLSTGIVDLAMSTNYKFGNAVKVQAFANGSQLPVWRASIPAPPLARGDATDSHTLNLTDSTTASTQLVLNELFYDASVNFVELKVNIATSNIFNDNNTPSSNYLTTGVTYVCIMTLTRIAGDDVIQRCNILDLGDGWKILVSAGSDPSQLLTTHNGVIQQRLTASTQGV